MLLLLAKHARHADGWSSTLSLDLGQLPGRGFSSLLNMSGMFMPWRSWNSVQLKLGMVSSTGCTMGSTECLMACRCCTRHHYKSAHWCMDDRMHA